MIDEGPFPLKERVLAWVWWHHYRFQRFFREGWQRWLATKLPRKVALFAMVRVAAYATMNRCGNTSPTDLTYDMMHTRWEERACD